MIEIRKHEAEGALTRRDIVGKEIENILATPAMVKDGFTHQRCFVLANGRLFELDETGVYEAEELRAVVCDRIDEHRGAAFTACEP